MDADVYGPTVSGVTRRVFFAQAGIMSAVAALGPMWTPELSRPDGRSQVAGIKLLTFDVGGTVFDWHRTVRDELATVLSANGLDVDPAALTNDWRRGLFAVLRRVREGDLPFMNIDQMHRLALNDLLEQHDATAITEQEREALTLAWHRIKPWPDSRAGLTQLRTRFTVSGLSILSFSLLVDASKAADLHWDAIISCEFLGYYKPDPRA